MNAMRFKQAFTLFPRRSKRTNKTYWYYQTYDIYGVRTVPRSTGMTSKAAAMNFCIELFSQDQLISDGSLGFQSPGKAAETFEQYAKIWWKWDSCPYVMARRTHGTKTHPGIKQSTVDRAATITQNSLIPFFGKMKLSTIRPKDVDKWIIRLRKQGLSPKTVNNHRSILRIMLEEAVRNGYLDRNPVSLTLPTIVEAPSLQLLTNEEVSRLFSKQTFRLGWKGNLHYYTANLLAALTGMREGEIRALQPTAIKKHHLTVAESYDTKHGLTTTKTSIVRVVPLPKMAEDLLWDLIGRQKGTFIFSINGHAPISSSKCTESLYAALESIGIPREEQKRRKITFHAWRHWFNTMCVRRNIPPIKIRNVTGHTGQAMTDHYTDFAEEDYKEILTLQESIAKTIGITQTQTSIPDARGLSRIATAFESNSPLRPFIAHIEEQISKC